MKEQSKLPSMSLTQPALRPLTGGEIRQVSGGAFPFIQHAATPQLAFPFIQQAITPQLAFPFIQT